MEGEETIKEKIELVDISKKEERALCKLLNRPLERLKAMGIKGRDLEEFWALIQKIHDAQRGKEGTEEEEVFFDGAGIELNREGRAVIEYSYSCRGRLIFFEFVENAPLKALKPILKFARKYKYCVFDVKEIGSVIEGKRQRKEVFDYASKILVPFY